VTIACFPPLIFSIAIKAGVGKTYEKHGKISQSSGALFSGHAVLLIKNDKGKPPHHHTFLISQMFPGEGNQTSSHIGNYLFKLVF
jgi:hypothetical protein